jgi:hypothetical protein
LEKFVSPCKKYSKAFKVISRCSTGSGKPQRQSCEFYEFFGNIY